MMMMRRRGLRCRGAAMIEAAVCLAVFTPVFFLAIRLGYGANQMHDLQAAVSNAAKLAGACASQDAVRRAAVAELPGLNPADVAIDIDRAQEPAMVRVTIRNYRVVRAQGDEPLQHAPTAQFPYACD